MSDAQTANSGGEPLTVSSAAEQIMGLLGEEEKSSPATETQVETATQEEAATTDNAAVEGAEAEPAPEGEAEPEKYTVKVDGKELQVTRDELIKGYQLETDYRRKTAEIAEQRRQYETGQQAILRERQHYAQQLQSIIPALQQQLTGKYANVDWLKISKEDPAGYVQLRAEFDMDQARLQIAQTEGQRVQQAAQQEQDQRQKKWVSEQEAELVKMFPEWGKDIAKGKAEIKQIREFLVERGVSREMAAQVLDANQLSIARDAMLYRQALRSKTQAAAKVENVPKVQKPGTNNTSAQSQNSEATQAAMNRLRKTGKVADAAEAMRRIGIS